MFTKLEQRSWIKIEVARCRRTFSFQVLHDECGDVAIQKPILHENEKSHTGAAVTDLLSRWQWEILEHQPFSPDTCPRDYDLFAKVKEPL